MVRYLNMKTVYGVETVDQVNETDFKTWNEFVRELKNLKKQYALIGMNVYSSKRATKDWKNK